MWSAIYVVLLVLLVVILGGVCIYGGLLAYNMIQDLLNYIHSKKEMRVNVKDLGIKPKLHRSEHMKNMMQKLRLDKAKKRSPVRGSGNET